MERHSRIQEELQQRRPFRAASVEAGAAILRTGALIRRHLNAVLRPYRLTWQQYNVLRILRGAGPTGLPMQTIADRMVDLTPGVTRLVDRLERTGLVRREKGRDDQRQVLCALTDAGQGLLAQLDAPVDEADDFMLSGLEPRQLEQLIALLDGVRSVLASGDRAAGASSGDGSVPGPDSDSVPERDTTSPPITTVPALAARLTGTLLRPGEEGYDDARRIQNGLFDRRPALIARCGTAEDVAAAVEYGRVGGLEIAVKGGGHGVAGLATVDDGLMIDLSSMKRIDVDAAAGTVDVEPGVTWAELNAATQKYGSAVPGGVISSTGVAGLTLGGGWGWLSSVHGLSVDNLLAARVVTADGRVLDAGPQDNADLFWGLRGGSGNFGVVVSFRFRLRPIGPRIFGGLVAYPIARAGEVLRLHRELTASAPDELSLSAGLLSAPDGTRLVALVGCWCGDPEEGRAAFRPVRDLGAPALDQLGPTEYCAMNQILDAAFPKGALNYWKSRYLDRLEDEGGKALVQAFERCPSPMTGIVLDHWHGAAARVPADATAFPHRRDGYSLLILSQWLDPAETERNVRWTRETYAAIRPYAGRGRYANFLDRDDASDPDLSEAYGLNRQRLQAVKARYDPENLFHLNVNVAPAT